MKAYDSGSDNVIVEKNSPPIPANITGCLIFNNFVNGVDNDMVIYVISKKVFK